MATIFPADDFDPEADAMKLHDAMDQLGTNEGDIIDVVARRTQAERLLVADQYKQAYGQDLEDDLKSELGHNFEIAVLALMTPPRKYDAQQLRAAMKGAGTEEATLIEILSSRTNEEIDEIKQLYNEEFDRDLEDDVQSETSGYFRRLLVSQLNAGRDDTDDVDDEMAQSEAQEIFDAGEDQWGTDEAAINKILCLRNYSQLQATFDAYAEISDKDIEDVIKAETNGTLQSGLLAIVKYTRSPTGFFAERLYDSMHMGGTDDDTLIRILVSRSEVDLAEIMDAFQVRYEQSLGNYVSDDVSGDYKRLLLKIFED